MMRRFLHLQSGELSGSGPEMSKESAENESVHADGLTASPGPGHHAGMMSESPATSREMTFGEKAVGLSFNPGGNQAVNEIKRAYADIIDLLHIKRKTSTNADEQRMLSLAITESQTAQMWAVKAVTWNF